MFCVSFNIQVANNIKSATYLLEGFRIQKYLVFSGSIETDVTLLCTYVKCVYKEVIHTFLA